MGLKTNKFTKTAWMTKALSILLKVLDRRIIKQSEIYVIICKQSLIEKFSKYI